MWSDTLRSPTASPTSAPATVALAGQNADANDGIGRATPSRDTGSDYIKLTGRNVVARDVTGQPVEDGLSILETLVFATQEAAAGATMLASWANRLPETKAPIDPRNVAAELPPSPALYLPLNRWRRETGLPDETLACTDVLFRRLAMARKTLIRCIADADTMGTDKALALHFFLLIRSARDFADSAREALLLIRGPVALALDERFTRSCDILFALLIECIDGKSPCLDDERLRRPELPQRRRTPRVHYGENVQLDLRDSRGATYTIRAYARDVSTGGLGLSGVPYIERDTTIHVHTTHGRCFAARLAWWRDGDAGLTFVEPLSPEDPLVAS